MGTRRTIVTLLTLATLVLAATACSASVSTGGSSPGGTRTYTNDQYHFSITYDTVFVQGKSSGGNTSGSGSVFDIAFASTSGAKIDGKYIDGIQISVYKLARAVKPAEVPGLKKQFANVVDELLATLPSAKIVQPLQLTAINGVPGFKLSYTFAQQGVDIAAVSYFLVKGQYEYEVTGQASKTEWTALSPKLQAAIQSFTVK